MGLYLIKYKYVTIKKKTDILKDSDTYIGFKHIEW